MERQCLLFIQIIRGERNGKINPVSPKISKNGEKIKIQGRWDKWMADINSNVL